MVSHIFKMEECEVTFYPGWLWRESIWTKKSCQGDEINILKWIMINIITIITAKRKKKSSPSSPLITNDHRRKKKMVTIISRSRLSAQIEKIPPQDSFHASKQGHNWVLIFCVFFVFLFSFFIASSRRFWLPEKWKITFCYFALSIKK